MITMMPPVSDYSEDELAGDLLDEAFDEEDSTEYHTASTEVAMTSPLLRDVSRGGGDFHRRLPRNSDDPNDLVFSNASNFEAIGEKSEPNGNTLKKLERVDTASSPSLKKSTGGKESRPRQELKRHPHVDHSTSLAASKTNESDVKRALSSKVGFPTSTAVPSKALERRSSIPINLPSTTKKSSSLRRQKSDITRKHRRESSPQEQQKEKLRPQHTRPQPDESLSSKQPPPVPSHLGQKLTQPQLVRKKTENENRTIESGAACQRSSSSSSSVTSSLVVTSRPTVTEPVYPTTPSDTFSSNDKDEEAYECVDDDIELHSEDEDEIPYIKKKEEYFPPRRGSTLDGVDGGSRPTSFSGSSTSAKEPWTPVRNSFTSSVPSIVSGPAPKSTLLRSPSVRSNSIAAPLATPNTPSSPGVVTEGTTVFFPLSQINPSSVSSQPSISSSSPSFPRQSRSVSVPAPPPALNTTPSSSLPPIAADAIPDILPRASIPASSPSEIPNQQNPSIVVHSQNDADSASDLASFQPVVQCRNSLHPQLPTTLSESAATSLTSIDCPTEPGIPDEGMYLEFKRNSVISANSIISRSSGHFYSTGNLASTERDNALADGISVSSLDSAKSRASKPTIDRTVKPMSASTGDSINPEEAPDLAISPVEEHDEEDEAAPPIPPRPEMCSEKSPPGICSEDGVVDRSNSQKSRERQRRPLPPLPNRPLPAGDIVKDSSSSASSTISTDVVGIQNLDNDIPEVPAPDVPNVSNGIVDYDDLQIEPDGYLAPFGVTGSIALSTGGALANGNGSNEGIQANPGASSVQYQAAQQQAAMKIPQRWDIRTRTLPALPPDAVKYNKLQRGGSLSRVDGDFDDYSKPENDDFEDETYDKVEGTETVRLPIRADLDDDDDEDDDEVEDDCEINSADEDEINLDNPYELDDPVDGEAEESTKWSAVSAATGTENTTAVASLADVEEKDDLSQGEESAPIASEEIEHDNVYEDVGRHNATEASLEPSSNDELSVADVTNDSLATPERNPRPDDGDETADEYEDDGDYSWPSDEFQSDEDDFPAEVEERDRGKPRTTSILQKMKSTADMLQRSNRDSFFLKKNPFKRSNSAIHPMHASVGLNKAKMSSMDDERRLVPEDEDVFVELDMTPRHEPEPILADPPSDLPEEARFRRCVVKSVIDSELNYIHSLRKIIDDYENPLSEGVVISKNKCSIIFFKVKEILQCHGMFQIALKPFIQNWDQDEKIGDVFLGSFSKAMVLEVYSAYVNNFSSAMDTVKRCARKEPQFAEYLRMRQSQSPDKLSLFGLMVKPVQRFPQYILQFQDLLKNTPPDHHDRLKLQLALTQLESIAQILNERKRESDLRMAVKCIADSLTGNSKLTKSLPLKDRCLVRVDNVRQLDYQMQSHTGTTKIVKTKPRRLVLMNDLLMSVEAERKELDDSAALQDVVAAAPTSSSTGSVSTSSDHLKLKWIHNLDSVELVDLTKSQFLSTYSGEFGTATEADLQSILYRELQQMLHDLEQLGKIDQIVSGFNRPPPQLSSSVIQSLSDDLRHAIHAKNEELKIVGSNTIQISVPSSVKSSNVAKSIQYIFQMDSVDTKEEWIAHMTMAKLGLSPGNSPCWSMSENDRCISSNMPLFARTMPLNMLTSQANVACVVRYTPISPSTGLPGISQLFVGSCDKFSSQINVVSLRRNEPSVTEVISLAECKITAMEVVPGTPGDAVNESPSTDASTHIFPTETLWVAAKSRRVTVYCLSTLEKTEITSFTTHESVTVIKVLRDKVFFALESGSIAIYQRSAEGYWRFEDYRLLKLGRHPVSSMILIDGSLWVSCGSVIHAIDVETEGEELRREIHDSLHISHLVKTGNALWVAFKDSEILRLYYLETFQLLQDLNIESSIKRLLNDSCDRQRSLLSPSVSYISSSSGFLWIGTSVGIVLVIALPRLEGAPLISGRVSMCYHAHKGPVRFILPLMPMQRLGSPDRPMDASSQDEGQRSDLMPPPSGHQNPAYPLNGPASNEQPISEGIAASRESLRSQGRMDTTAPASELDFSVPPVATSEQKTLLYDGALISTANYEEANPDLHFEINSAPEDGGHSAEKHDISLTADSEAMMCHSSSRASFNALIDDVMPREGERDVSFLYKSLMRGAVLDVEAAEATCNDAILIHNNQQNHRKGASQENILGVAADEPFARSGVAKPAAAQGAASGNEISLYSTVKKNVRQSIRKARQSILSQSVMMGNLQSNVVSLRSPTAESTANASSQRPGRVDSIISQTSSVGAPPSPFLPTVTENFGIDEDAVASGSSFGFAVPAGRSQPTSHSRRTSESSNSVDLQHSNVAPFHFSADSPQQPITTHVDSFLSSTGGTSSASPASDSPTFRSHHNHGGPNKDSHRRDRLAPLDGLRGSHCAGMDASLTSSSVQTASDNDPSSLRRRKTVTNSTRERTFLIVSGGDGYCSWHNKDGAERPAAQKRPGSAGSSSGSSVNGSHQRLYPETNEASLILWQMKL